MSSIQSIERAFSILQIVSDQPTGVRLTDIIPEVDLPRSTVARILSTLENLGAVERHPESSGYRIGPSILELAMQPTYLVTLINPYLQKLAAATDESVVLVLSDDEKIFFADQIHSRHRLQVREWTGQSQDIIHADSAGKVFLAHWREADREAYLARPLRSAAPRTIAVPEQLRQHLVDIRKQGYAWAYEELEEGLAGVSAPVFDAGGEVIAVINVTGPIFRLPGPQENQGVTQLLIDTCQQISDVLKSRHSGE